MSREKKKFRPGQELKEVFEAIDQRRSSAREKFKARKQGLEAKARLKAEQQAAKKAAAAEAKKPAKRKSRLKRDPAEVERRAKEIMASKQAD